MRIAICGVNISELLEKVEKHYNVKSVYAKGGLYESARITYDFDNVDNVIFNGCVLDYIENEKDIHPIDEQIILCALDNIDVVYVYTTYMSDEDISKYHLFDEFFGGNVVDVNDVDTFVIE